MLSLPEEIIVDIQSRLDVYDRLQSSLIRSTWRSAFFRKQNLQDVVLAVDSADQCSKFSHSSLEHTRHLRILNRAEGASGSVLRSEKHVMELLCSILSRCELIESIDLAGCKLLANRIPLLGHESDGEMQHVMASCRDLFSRVHTLRLRYCFGWLLAACGNLRCLVVEDRMDLDCSLADFVRLLSKQLVLLHLPETAIVDSDLQTLARLAERGVQLQELDLGTQITYVNMPFCERYANVSTLTDDLRNLCERHAGVKLRLAMFIDGSEQLQRAANRVLDRLQQDASLSSLTLSIRCDSDYEVQQVHFDRIPFRNLQRLSVAMHSAEAAQTSLFRTVFRSLLTCNWPRLALTHLELSLPTGMCTEWCELLAAVPNLRVLRLTGRSGRGPPSDFCLHVVARHCPVLHRLALANLDCASHYSCYGYSSPEENSVTLASLRSLELRSARSLDRFPLRTPTLRCLVMRTSVLRPPDAYKSYLRFWRQFVVRNACVTHLDLDESLELEQFAAWWCSLTALPCLHTVVLREPQMTFLLCEEWPRLRDSVLACRCLRWLCVENLTAHDFTAVARDAPYLHIVSPRTLVAY